MPKQYFSSKKKSDRTLLRIFIAVILMLIAVYGVYRLIYWSPEFMKNKNIVEKILPTSEKTNENPFEYFKKLWDESKYDELRTELKKYIKKEKNTENLTQACLMLINVEKKAGNMNDAFSVAEEAQQKCTGSMQYPYLLYQYALTAEDINKKDIARSTYQTIIDRFSKGNRVYGYYGLARLEEKENNKIKARDYAQLAVADAPWDSDIWNEALDLLGKLNVELIFSNIPTPESRVYTVQKGDTIITIGTKLNTPVGMLCRANQLEENAVLRPNQTLKYTPKDFRLFVERSKCRAFLVDDQGIFKRYKVGLGKPGHETALGSYKIGNKQKNPTWFKPGEGPIPAGDPRNELGTRWMPLVPSEPGLPTDLGLHGTIAPETVGTYSSNGCVRFYPEEVEEIYDLIVRSTPVFIKEVVNYEDIFPIEKIDVGISETTPEKKQDTETKTEIKTP
ncbi:MAG TPA: L,D-transpeptidase family protein [Candidatus Hydrogenedens sp.]|nr:L,D-transpeptidase family protein [Candidatus Hydrogenedens sp.]HOL20788.1 L,D-transpeptidase family protein [Candidatus Hydrogenedens sp.]HPP59320.1 L,D-transpeptidase family protein [Candidatus Hydrogenedens sp.]